MDKLRKIEAKDIAPLRFFWAMNGIDVDPKELYPMESSYVFERKGELLYAVAVYLVKGISTAYVEAVIRNPSLPADFEALLALQLHLEQATKAEGYSRIIGAPKTEELHKHYTKLGYNRVGTAIITTKDI